jgi:hypothetical protein
MEQNRLIEYLNELEQRVIIPCILEGRLGMIRPVTVRNGKAAKTELAALIGTRVYCKKPLVIEYFGLFRRSTGFMVLAVEVQRDTKTLVVPCANISAVRDSHIRTHAPELLPEFGQFKETIIALRFPKKQQ